VTARTKVILAVVALVVVAGVVTAVALAARGVAIPVETATVQQEDLAMTVTAAGLVESGSRADVFPPTAGVLDTVNVRGGDRVKAGTVLATLETGPLEIQVAQARAALASAQAQEAALDKQEPSDQDLAATKAATAAAKAAYDAALDAEDAASQQAPSTSDLAAAAAARSAAWAAYDTAQEAYDALADAYEIAPNPSLEASLTAAATARDQAKAAYFQAKSAEDKLLAYDGSAAAAQAAAAVDQAYAGYLSAKAQQAKLEGTSLAAERRAAQAAVEQAREALEAAEENLADAELVAPIDGVVLLNALGAPSADGQTPQAAEGISVSPAAAPFTVVDFTGLQFVAEVDEVDIDAVDPGMKATIELDAFPEQSFETTVTSVNPAATLTVTGGTAFSVTMNLTADDAEVLIGMKGDVTIEVDSVPSAVTLPVEALFDEGGTEYVYLIGDDHRLERTRVETGRFTETTVQILSGVEPGQVVALSGPVELVDGARVKVAD
jgi:HlyD family secretion protein